VGASTTATLNAAAPIFGLLGAVVFLRERPAMRNVVGTLVAFVGVALVVWADPQRLERVLQRRGRCDVYKSGERGGGMTAGQWCYECGKNNPARYEAIYTPRDGGMPLHLVICESCGREMDAEAFTKLAMATFPSDAGTVEVVNDPALQGKVGVPEELPERE
jgi:hypothetical protein